ncbi:MAG TPA: DUF2321 domain-containing protein [Candidatus Limnocylindria bacterium]|jgi:hypothetical protein|nr:DUF2321 domain-containing protein [Candidatus Limnocylindria bacterium]
MSGKDPIELPGLAQQRRGPTAAVCASGHVFSWSIDAANAPSYCAKCGDRILLVCPACNGALPDDPEMLAWVPYHTNCTSCGRAYPWKADAIARAKRTLAEQAEIENWSDTIKARADDVVDDIAADRAAPSAVIAALAWLARHGAESATETILDAVERLASPTLKQSLRASFPGRF